MRSNRYASRTGRARRSLVGRTAHLTTLVLFAGLLSVGVSSAIPAIASVDTSSEWKLDPTPAGSGLLSNIDCPSATTCFTPVSATSAYRGSSDVVQRIERWDGRGWALSAGSDNLGIGRNTYGKISCASTDFCVAIVNRYSGSEGLSAGFSVWSGTTWSVDDRSFRPNVQLNGVSCVNKNFCAAVGFPTNLGSNPLTYVSHWNGAIWTADANPVGSKGQLLDVSCESSISCVAVGRGLEVRANVDIVSWDGVDWRALSAPTALEVSILRGVNCVAGSCVVVGGRTFFPETPVGDPVCSYSASNVRGLPNSHTKAYDGLDSDNPGPVALDAAGLLYWAAIKFVGGRDSISPHPSGSLSAAPQSSGTRIAMSAAAIYANGSPSDNFSWDWTNDGKIDHEGIEPVVVHNYTSELRGKRFVTTAVRVSYSDGSSSEHRICIRQGAVSPVVC